MTAASRKRRLSSAQICGLLAAWRGGSPSAITSLLELYRPYLLATAAARLDAKMRAKAGPSDLVQETLIAAQQAAWPAGQWPSSERELRFWLRNLLLARLKALHRRYYRSQRRSVHRERSLDEGKSRELIARLMIDQPESPGGSLANEELRRKLEKALARLPVAYREVIRWRNYEGRRFTDIGKVLERSPDAVRMLWGRAIRQLKRNLEIDDVCRE